MPRPGGWRKAQGLGSLPWVLSPGLAPSHVPEQSTKLCERWGSRACDAGPAQLRSCGLCSPAQL